MKIIERCDLMRDVFVCLIGEVGERCDLMRDVCVLGRSVRLPLAMVQSQKLKFVS